MELLAFNVSEVVGGLEVEAYIRTLYDVGEPDHPDVVAVIEVPATPVPDKETDPPEGIDTGADTVAVLEFAEADPPAFVAVTRQRIGLAYPREKKFEGGVYDELVAPEILRYVDPWSRYCH